MRQKELRDYDPYTPIGFRYLGAKERPSKIAGVVSGGLSLQGALACLTCEDTAAEGASGFGWTPSVAAVAQPSTR